MNDKYFKYAIGEIILVVIGILIALSINNWNEKRKENERQNQYVNSLITDLKAEIKVLKQKNLIDSVLLIQLEELMKRISNDQATIDTFKYIARYQFVPFFDPSNELNRNTMTALLSTGDVGQFKPRIRDAILNYNSRQISELKVMDANVDIFLNIMYKSKLGPSDHPLATRYSIDGAFQDLIWDNINDLELIESLSVQIESKMIMHEFISGARSRLISGAESLLTVLENEY